MKTIALTQGKHTVVDDADYDFLSQWKWYARKGHATHYAARNGTRNGTRCTIFMHSVLCTPDSGRFVDHINHDGLDNRRANLRVCTRQQNNVNRVIQRPSRCGYKGVCFNKKTGKWFARIVYNKREQYLGSYTDPAVAASAYDAKAVELHGEFAVTNFAVPRCRP